MAKSVAHLKSFKKNQILTIPAALLNSDFPVDSSFSARLSQFFKSDWTVMKSNMNETSRERLADESCVA